MKTMMACVASVMLLVVVGVAVVAAEPDTVPAAPIEAAPSIATKTVEYKNGETACVGYLALPKGYVESGSYPAVLIIHDWAGRREFDETKAKQIAELGYIAFCADMYGKDVRPKTTKECQAAATPFYGKDRTKMRTAAKTAFDEMLKVKGVDKTKTGVMGFCFGGCSSLELARSGADVQAVISFHGNLATPDPSDANNIKGAVLVLHGADDPFVKEAEVTGLFKEMREAEVDWQFHAYGGAVHAFTNPEAGDDNSRGAAYNKAADRRSWTEMKAFFVDVFGK